jgi:hypothetical protein
MAVNQKALSPLENLESPALNVAPYIEGREKPKTSDPNKKPTDNSTGFVSVEPLKEVDNSAKIATENIAAGYQLPENGTEYSFVS